MDLRKLLLAGVATTALAGYAAAQGATQPSTAPSAAPGAMQSAPADGAASTARADAAANEPRFANYKGADVVDGEKNSIATIADILIDDTGQAHQLVLAEGGILGVGATYRAFEIDSLPALAEGDVRLDLTKESLAALPEYTYPGKGKTAEAPAAGGAPAGDRGSSTAAVPKASTAPAEGRAATEESSGTASQDMANLWPVSAIVGAEIKLSESQEASATEVSDFRFSADGKVERVVLNKGGVLGVGGDEQTVPFSDLSISGTPDEPVIALNSGSSVPAGDPAAPKTQTERAPEAPMSHGSSPAAPGGSAAPSAPAQ